MNITSLNCGPLFCAQIVRAGSLPRYLTAKIFRTKYRVQHNLQIMTRRRSQCRYKLPVDFKTRRNSTSRAVIITKYAII